MKRISALILCVMMVLSVITSCTTLEEDDKGAVIDVYLTNEIYDFDPARGFNDASTAKFLSLVFEGLTRLDENGDWKAALMDDYVISQDDDEAFKIQITLNRTKWSDSRDVQANDIVYAWKRILDPEFKCEAANLLFDLKNAYKIKLGDASVDDLGVAAIETYVLEVEFEKKTDLDDFFRKAASPALVPVREDIVSTNPNWAKKASSLITNGPFDVKEFTKGETLRLERSAYYYRDMKEDGALDEYVIPYRIITHYDRGGLANQLEEFLTGKIFYLGEIPLAKRAEFAEYANASDYPATHTYLFNENNPVLSNADVRRALSLAVDRNKIAELVVYADPATGLVPPITNDADSGTKFRDAGGDLISKEADMAQAKRLVNSAGVSGTELTISIRNDEVDEAVANYVKGVWEELGFKVSVKKLRYSLDPDDSTILIDNYYNDYINGNFDIIAVDMTMLSSDASSALIPFAKNYSGYGVNMEPEADPDENGDEIYKYDQYTHVTGYDNENYNALFDKYYETTDISQRTSILHEAEKMLIDDAVVMPLYFEQDAFMFSDVLDHIGSSYYGRVFNNMKMDDYMSYKEDQGSIIDNPVKDD
ncbi:MAG: hypothetical protein IKN38_10240 [Clostridia bacterium]|nr:hypothetical protein [Clostridia bacterium]